MLNLGEKLAPSKRSELLNRILVGTKRLTAIMDDILVLSRADAGKLQTVKVPTDLPSLFKEIIDEVDIGDKERHLFQFNVLGDFKIANTDEKTIRHIVSNLLSNAVHYSPDGRLVKLDLHCEEGQFWFEVSDQGVGIPEDDRKNLFEPFFRASNVGPISGSGLGLNIVKRYTELLGGKIALISSEIGTCFRVTIPAK